MGKSDDEGEKAVNRQGADKNEEYCVVSGTNTRTNPRAVMVHSEHAAVTVRALDCPWRSNDTAGITELDFG